MLTAWEDFLLDVLRVVVIVWAIGVVLVVAAVTPRYLRGGRR